MITTVLLDLDDTLLENKDEVFIPAYFEKLSSHLSHLVPKERMLAQLIAGTEAMLENKDPSLHLKDVFDQVFYPGIRISPDELSPHTAEFYQSIFPRLEKLTKPIADSRLLIEYARSWNLELVVATNPLYPMTAVEQRLAWAGFPTDLVEFALITSYENSHFTKPHLEYYAEILAKLGRNPHDAVMIGNDSGDDIEPAKRLGIATFHISDEGHDDQPFGDHASALEWLKSDPEIIDPRRSSTSQSLLARLIGNLAAFGELQNYREEKVWKRRPRPNSWAGIEVIAHLRDVEREINFPRIKSILESEEPFLSAVDSDRWAEERAYIDDDPLEVIRSLWQARMRTIGILREEPGAWERRARHAIFGPTNLSELILIFIEHDLLHLRQLNTILNQD